METSVKLYSLKHSNVKTSPFALLFVAGNIALPQLCHLVPYGGPTLLPIYFFTLIAAYKYGFLVGLLTAILSPVINHLLFAMPSEAVLPILPGYKVLRCLGIIKRFTPMKITGRIQNTYQVWAKFSSAIIVCT